MASHSRRALLNVVGGCALCAATQTALGRILALDLTPTVTAGYRPGADDERGLWHSCERLEQDLASSTLLVRDQSLVGYLHGVMQTLLGPQAADVRVYLVRDPEFNASMAPNGMMLVHTGLLARMRSEGQLAAVLGHESGHYLRRHTLQNWRSVKARTALMSFLALGGAAAGGGWYALANGANSALLLSLFSYSRELESEADAYGLQLLSRAGYPPGSAAEVWSQLIEERKASAAARNKKYKDKALSALSTHPPNAVRLQDLTDSAAEIGRKTGGAAASDGRGGAWRSALLPVRSSLLEEQVKLNDPGGSLYLINNLASDGWDGALRYYEGEVYRLRGEPGDAERAADAYAAAIQQPDAPPEAFRAHGYAQIKRGEGEAGRRSLARYLELSPHAPDAAIVAATLQQ